MEQQQCETQYPQRGRKTDIGKNSTMRQTKQETNVGQEQNKEEQNKKEWKRMGEAFAEKWV